MDVFSEIAYSDAGMSGRDIFLAEFSDVIFYFEDEAYEAVYEKLISKIAPMYLTNSINCLGGKTQILKAARSKNDIGKPRVFIVDKDFDDILGLLEDLEGLIYLDRYCFENYLLEIPALIQLVIDRYALSTTAAHLKCKDFEDFYSRLLDRYTYLTRLFLVIRKLKLPIQTTKLHYSEFVEAGGISEILSDEIITKYKQDLLQISDWITDDEVLEGLVDSAFDSQDGQGAKTYDQIKKHLCGKHLLGFMLCYIERTLNVDLKEISTESLYMDLIGRIDRLASQLENVTTKINLTVHSQRSTLHK